MATKLKLKIGAEAAKVKAAEGLGQYTGPTPPPGVYAAKVKTLQVKPTRKGDKTMLVAVIEFEAPKNDANAKYNGFAIFHRLVIPESMDEEWIDLKVGQINRLFDAIGGDEKLRTVFWGGNAVMDDKGEKIVKLGKYTIGGKGFKGLPVVVSARSENYKRKSKGSDGKVVSEDVRALRVNDIYPADHAIPSSTVSDPTDIDEDEQVIIDDSDIDDAVVEDEQDTDVPEDDGAEDPEPEDEPAEDEPEDEGDYVDEDGDEDGYIEEDPEPEPEPEPEPAKPAARKRRSAF